MTLYCVQYRTATQPDWRVYKADSALGRVLFEIGSGPYLEVGRRWMETYPE